MLALVFTQVFRRDAHVDGGAHQRAAFDRLKEHREQVRRRLLAQVERLGHAAREVHHRLAAAPALQRLVRPEEPGVRHASVCAEPLDTQQVLVLTTTSESEV